MRPPCSSTIACSRSASECYQSNTLDAIDLINDDKYDEALASSRRVLSSMEGAMGKEAEELLYPLRVIGGTLIRSGRLDDAYNVMMRSMTLCEKHHGEEGMETCQLRTDMGALPF